MKRLPTFFVVFSLFLFFFSACGRGFFCQFLIFHVSSRPKFIFTALKTFEELGLQPELLRAISEMGFEQPMPIQEEVIPYLLEKGNDVTSLAQTGTGKRAAYGLPLIQNLRLDDRTTQAVVLSPTRELCLQIADDMKDFGRYMEGLHIQAVYGGASIESQIRALKKGVQVIIATPGRLIDLMQRGVANLDAVENIVLDEAD